MIYTYKTEHLRCPLCKKVRIGFGDICKCNNITDPDDEVTTVSTDLH